MKLVIRIRDNGDEKIIEAEAGASLRSALSEAGISVPLPCGGNGKCGKCAAKVISGNFSGVLPDEDGKILICRAVIDGDAELELPPSLLPVNPMQTPEASVPSAAPPSHAIDAAADIGTTTVAASLFDTVTGERLACGSVQNPQAEFGADVVSRIQHCTAGHLAAECSLIRRAVADQLLGLLRDCNADPGRIRRVIVSANTVMTHIFCGADPSGIGASPFTPAFTGSQMLQGILPVPCDEIITVPCVSGYIGGDIVSGLVCSEEAYPTQTYMLADLGTNGELALKLPDGGIISASVAIGPAFEGSCISCGMGATRGAIDHVRIGAGGSVSFSLIGGNGFSDASGHTDRESTPIGICGSGLIDAIGEMLRIGIIDETGGMPGFESFYLTPDIYISRMDIRQFQLAKSALRSGIELLSEKAGNIIPDKILLCGGFGYYLDPESALFSGLLPEWARGRILAAGNTSLLGAEKLLKAPSLLDKAAELAKKVLVYELSSEKSFTDKFMKNMFFEPVLKG